MPYNEKDSYLSCVIGFQICTNSRVFFIRTFSSSQLRLVRLYEIYGSLAAQILSDYNLQRGEK